MKYINVYTTENIFLPICRENLHKYINNYTIINTGIFLYYPNLVCFTQI